jgi:glycerophosphoryl diester phosphodiesterase
MTTQITWTAAGGPYLIGHRGYPARARENTLASFAAALDAGCHGVELDVRLTRDGVPVVHHDATVTTARGAVAIGDLESETLRTATFASPDGPYAVPRLADVLAWFGGRCLLNVEVKPPGAGAHAAVATAVAAAIHAVEPPASILVSSFDIGMLAALERLALPVPLGFLFTETRGLDAAEREPVAEALAWLHPVHDIVDAALIARARRHGLSVISWTADEALEVERLLALGVAAVITNHPERVKHMLA